MTERPHRFSEENPQRVACGEDGRLGVSPMEDVGCQTSDTLHREGRCPLLHITRTDDVVRLEGELDMSTAPEFRTILRESLPSSPLVIDASELAFMDSSGVVVLLEVARSRNGGGPVVLRGPRPNVRKVIDLVLPGGVEGLEVQG